ncbi:MAG: glucosaminidase domain-containing protein [Peptostreptococcaceae bacterium]|nr:glucosaminidase domain-containing protein [Peptostreptococcaceae bacterium]
MDKKQFIEKVGRIAKEEQKKSGILASLTISQAILESGWGGSGLTKKANALFGIKAGTNWKGRVYNAQTKECYDGKTFETITAGFRAYNSWEESIADHTRLLTTASRYKKLIGETDYKRACKEIHAAGYATDPGYPAKLIKIIEENNLTNWDLTSPQKEIKTEGAATKMKQSEFIKKLYDIKNNYKTIYAWGVFGGPITDGLIEGKAKQYPNWYNAAKKTQLRQAGRAGAFGFDCVNLIKAILWGWNGNKNASWGGAKYASNGVPDIGADGMINKCIGTSSNFSNIVPGEAVWLPGHIGVYVGSGRVIECTPKWSNGVQETACLNIGSIAGLNGRRWKLHGKIPYITYAAAPAAAQKPTSSPAARKSIQEIAKEVIAGKWGNGNDRRNRLQAAGYNYNEVQAAVNKLV